MKILKHDVTSYVVTISMRKLMKLKLDFASRAEARNKIEFTHSMTLDNVDSNDDDVIMTMMM